jgi:hypothetical protein
MNIDTIIKNMEIKYYQNIQYTLNKNNLEYDWLNKHVEMLNNCIEISDIEENTTENEIKKDIVSGDASNISVEETVHEQIFADEDLYKKPWTKINAIHKILKIKEFVNNLKISSDQDKTELNDHLVSLVKNKVLSKKEQVKYDEINGKIISLVNLQYTNGKYNFLQNE